jgi:Tfp pilus assembly PilM family ATPase
MLKRLEMKEKRVGLHIGEEVVTAVQCAQNGSGLPVIQKAGWQSFTRDAPDDQIADAIRRLWRRTNFRTYTVAACVSSRAVLLKPFRYPHMETGELDSALKLDAEETLQQEPKDILIDWQLNPSAGTPGADGQPLEGILVAEPRAEVERELAIIRKARLYPAILDAGCMALANSYLALNEKSPSDATIGLVNICHQTADLSILVNAQSLFPYHMFSRASDWGQTADYLLQCMEDHLRHFQYKLHQKPVDRLLVTGRIQTAAPFLQKMSEQLGIPVDSWNPLEGLDCRCRALRRHLAEDEEAGFRMALSLGMALR